MGMLDKRFTGEERIADKLEQYDSANEVIDIPPFEAIVAAKPKNFLVGWIIKGISVCLLLGIGSYFLFQEDKSELGTTKLTNKEEKAEHRSTSTANTSSESRQKSTQSTSEVLTSIEKSDVSKRIDAHPNSKDKSPETNNETNNSNNNQSKSEILEDSNESIDFFLLPDDKNKENETRFGNGINDLTNKRMLDYSSTTKNLPFRNNLEKIENLPLLQKYLLHDIMNFEEMTVENKPIEVAKASIKRVLFGIQYNFGRTHAGAHETPFVSSFPTRIEGGKSFGYGLFGQINIDKRNWVRPSFTYSKNEHFHFVEGLKWPSGPSNMFFELYSHELKFGLDYGFNFLPEMKFFDLKAGVGLALHQVISLESNNYDTVEPEIVDNANELDLSPLSYKFFLGLDVPVYRGIIVGVEPYIIYQKRTARYTPSIFLADQGNYHLLSGINLTLKF